MLFGGILMNVLTNDFDVDEGVFEHSQNLFGLLKLAIVKISVGLITLEGLVENFLYESGKSPYNDDSEFTQQEQTQRAFCKKSCSLFSYSRVVVDLHSLPFIVLVNQAYWFCSSLRY